MLILFDFDGFAEHALEMALWMGSIEGILHGVVLFMRLGRKILGCGGGAEARSFTDEVAIIQGKVKRPSDKGQAVPRSSLRPLKSCMLYSKIPSNKVALIIQRLLLPKTYYLAQ
jgi:hypothetical protein